MAMKCVVCGGIIPDVSFGEQIDLGDCKNHIKSMLNIDYKTPKPMTSKQIDTYIKEYLIFRSD